MNSGAKKSMSVNWSIANIQVQHAAEPGHHSEFAHVLPPHERLPGSPRQDEKKAAKRRPPEVISQRPRGSEQLPGNDGSGKQGEASQVGNRKRAGLLRFEMRDFVRISPIILQRRVYQMTDLPTNSATLAVRLAGSFPGKMRSTGAQGRSTSIDNSDRALIRSNSVSLSLSVTMTNQSTMTAHCARQTWVIRASAICAVALLTNGRLAQASGCHVQDRPVLNTSSTFSWETNQKSPASTILFAKIPPVLTHPRCGDDILPPSSSSRTGRAGHARWSALRRC